MVDRVGRYSLVHVANNGETSKFKIEYKTGQTREKFTLTEIDALTTRFDNIDDFLHIIRPFNKNDINPKDKWEDGFCYIEYQENHKTKQLEVVFSDNEEIAEKSMEYAGLYKMKKDFSITEFTLRLLSIRRYEAKLYSYLRNNGYINNYLAEHLNLYIAYNSENYQNIDQSRREFSKIVKELTNYKTFRDINFGIYKYKKQTKEKTDLPQKIKKTTKHNN